MKKLKLGFTLAEIATAMTIVGIVAALVMPLVTKSVQKQQAGAILGRAVEQITLGNQNIIQLANVRTLDGGYADRLSFVTSKNLGIGNSNNSILSDLKTIVPVYWGLVSGDSTNSGKEFSFVKFPAGVSISGTADLSKTKLDDETGYSIDISAKGRDFSFKLLNNGALIPADVTTENVVKSGFRVK